MPPFTRAQILALVVLPPLAVLAGGFIVAVLFSLTR